MCDIHQGHERCPRRPNPGEAVIVGGRRSKCRVIRTDRKKGERSPIYLLPGDRVEFKFIHPSRAAELGLTSTQAEVQTEDGRGIDGGHKYVFFSFQDGIRVPLSQLFKRTAFTFVGSA